jgi:hypothetical protein
MTAKSRTWKVNKYTGIEARRTGYSLLPDFASTAHMIQGATLDAVFSDAQEAGGTVSMPAQIAAYVSFTRIKELCQICVLQPFSPWLFARVPPSGPERLIRKLSGKISSDEALEEWIQDTQPGNEEAAAGNGDPMKKKYRCTSCYLRGAKEYSHPVQTIGVHSRNDLYAKYISQGVWTRCLECQKLVGLKTGTSASHSVQASSVKRKADEEEGDICGLCSELFLGQHIAAACHWCSACKRPFGSEHWSGGDILRNHRRFKVNLVCAECRDQGCTAKDCTKYTCKEYSKECGSL